MITDQTRSDAIRIPEAPSLPGLRFRHYGGPQDHPAMAALNTATRAANGMVEDTTVDDLDRDYAVLINCDLASDFVAAELDGRLVGYGRVFWTDRNDGTRAFQSFCHLNPAVRRRGIGTALLAWQRRRVAALHASLPDDRPAIATAYAAGLHAWYYDEAAVAPKHIVLHLIGTALKDAPDDYKKLRHYFNHCVKGRKGQAWKQYYEARSLLPGEKEA